jgi:hypothetical protein
MKTFIPFAERIISVFRNASQKKLRIAVHAAITIVSMLAVGDLNAQLVANYQPQRPQCYGATGSIPCEKQYAITTTICCNAQN